MKLLSGLAATAIAVTAGFIGHQLNQHPRVQRVVTEGEIEATHYLKQLGFSCGVEAWNIKVMRDSAANQVNLTPRTTNIPTLIAMSGPSGTRLQPGQTYQLTGTRLTEAKLEGDSDIHLVLQSTLGSHPTMIVEIPEPGCASGSIVLNQITAARTAFSQQVASPNSLYNFVQFNPPNGIPVTLTGIGFVDFAHGQTGADPHQVELHPVISFRKLL